MVLPIVKYGHPVLRAKGARIERITPEIQTLHRGHVRNHVAPTTVSAWPRSRWARRCNSL